MKQSKEMLKEEQFFNNNLLLFVNRSTESFRMSLHSHEFIELAYVAEGKGFHHVKNEVQPIQKGQLFMIPIGVSHVFRPTSIDALKTPLIVYNCIFSLQLIDSLTSFIMDKPIIAYLQGLKDETLTYHHVFDADAAIEKLFLSLYREYSFQQSGSFAYLKTLLLQLIVTIHRLENFQHNKPMNKPAQFLQIIQYMEQTFAEELTLSLLTGLFKWSERQLQRLFKQHTGQTFNHYLQNLRIQKSCESLRHSELKISMVAAAVGYKDMKSFNKLFKRIVGLTPSSYRQQFK
jgi:AraC family L-rhamnose operon transcriptional activator RhaR